MPDIDETDELIKNIPEELPIVPLNDAVVYPYMLIPLIITDLNLVKVIDDALASHKIVGVFTQINKDTSKPGPDDIYRIGCAVLIQKMARFPDGHVRIIGQGLSRIEITDFTKITPYIKARVRILKEEMEIDDKAKALIRNAKESFYQIIDSSESYPEELKGIVMSVDEPGKLADLFSTHLNIDNQDKQKVLEVLDPVKRLELVYEFVTNELKIVKIGEQIRRDVRKELDKEQREYYLRQQMKAIRKELGEDDVAVEIEELRERIEETRMSERAKDAAFKEWNRLKKMSPNSAEYVVARTYLDWLLELPWEHSTEDILDVYRARKVLNRDHYDLDQVKERILEYLSVKKLKNSIKGSILCFVGPPGVGKTSLGKSIATALGRKFVRISLGGVRDEAEIRGHRRTYIGSLPGKIIQGIRTVGSNNPVFMLDEIDKLGNDFRGDPASALLEVLDPEQNNSFEDHYINLPFDLSRVMFITTANILDTVPFPLLDRMEILELPGYITSEKIEIAKRYLVPRQLEENGIPKGKFTITKEALRGIVEKYTREAGVRNLERKIAAIARKVAMKLVEGKRGPYRITDRNLKNYLGPEDFPEMEILSKSVVGVSTGMAKSPAGGVILFIEAIKMKGRGMLRLTGHLGDVMKESAHAALSFVKANCGDELAEEDIFANYDIHLHVPAGAIPKDGPSAGIAIATSLASLVTGRKVRNDVAMTGEITLTGKVLPVGAIKDKVIAAHRAGIKEIILPKLNKKDLEDIPAQIKKKLEFKLIDNGKDCFNTALINEEPKKDKRKC